MPIVARRTSDPPIGTSPSAVLLPTDGVLAPVRPPTPDRALAAEALRLLRIVDDPVRFPPAWSEASFVREVTLVRAHLGPIRSRLGLAGSYAREAFQTAPAADDDGALPGPVRVAYAIRWLELGEGASLPAWPLPRGRGFGAA